MRADTLGKIKDTNGVAYPDGADVLTTLAHELGRRGIEMALARVESSVSDLWKRAGTLDAIGRPTFHTVREAVDALS